MQQKQRTISFLLAAVIAGAGGYALIGEIAYMTEWAALYQVSRSQAFSQFFSYGTIITNLLVGCSMITILLFPNSGPWKFFKNPGIATAIAVYILLVFFGYNVMLRQLENPAGRQKVDNEIMHVAVPVLYFIYWLLFIPKSTLKWKHALVWLIGPAIYLAYILIRGSIDGFYAYPFLNVNETGYPSVLLYGAGSGIVIIILGLLLIAIARLQKKKAVI